VNEPSQPAIALRYADSVDEIDAVEPMWNALQEHHVRITPGLDPRTPGRELADAWRVRRSKYVRWLEDPETFFVIAEAGSGPIGYAFVTVGPGYASWQTGELGVDDMAITTTRTNVDAHRFYERLGFSPGFVVYHGKRPRG
jgi:GNAT superfamily N-acetyltransferase